MSPCTTTWANKGASRGSEAQEPRDQGEMGWDWCQLVDGAVGRIQGLCYIIGWTTPLSEVEYVNKEFMGGRALQEFDLILDVSHRISFDVFVHKVWKRTFTTWSQLSYNKHRDECTWRRKLGKACHGSMELLYEDYCPFIYYYWVASSRGLPLIIHSLPSYFWSLQAFPKV